LPQTKNQTTETTWPDQDIVIEARNVVRKYPGTTALKGVNFRVYRNKVNVLIGENGAGKSTLMRILAGAESATSGEIILEGRQVVFIDTRDAAKHGLAMVHQELCVLPNLSIADNIFAGREASRMGIVLDTHQADRSGDALRKLGGELNARGLAGALPLGQRQIVEIARSLAHRSKVLIFDEPTSALSSAECERLFAVIRDLKLQGVSIVYISHRLQELLDVGDYFTVLRDGRVAGEGRRSDVDRRWIVERMTGSSLSQDAPPTRPASVDAALLRTNALTVFGSGGRRLLDGINLTVAPGQILGIYGLLGSGRTELLETLAGARSVDSGEIFFRGQLCRFNSVAYAMRHGIALVPEDRKRDALLPALSIRENISLAAVRTFGRYFTSRRKESARVQQLARDLRINAENLELSVSSLSGGNQQKVVLARCLLAEPSLLLLDEPTRGVDVGAKAEIYQILRDLASRGMSIVFASSEIEEIQQLAQQVAVLCRGAIVDTFNGCSANEERLFSAASGIRLSGVDE
jgi:erythritol transport system ATP-binding protein